MKYAKKMKLVDINYTAEPLTGAVNNISPPATCSTEKKQNDAISFLDRHMKNILESTNLSDFDKWTQYNQALIRYLYWFKEKNTQETVNSNLKKLIEVFKNETENNYTNDEEENFVVDNDSDDTYDNVSVNRKRKRNTVEVPRKRVKSEITRQKKILKKQKSKLLFKNWNSKISV